jgi:hypothetical protein
MDVQRSEFHLTLSGTFKPPPSHIKVNSRPDVEQIFFNCDINLCYPDAFLSASTSRRIQNTQIHIMILLCTHDVDCQHTMFQ